MPYISEGILSIMLGVQALSYQMRKWMHFMQYL